MKNAKKIRYTRELHETIIVRDRQTFRSFCPFCGVDRDFMTPDEITRTFRIGTREILNFAEAGRVHTVDREDGMLLICQESMTGVQASLLARLRSNLKR